MRRNKHSTLSVSTFTLAVVICLLCSGYVFARSPVVPSGTSVLIAGDLRSYGDHRLVRRSDHCVGCAHDEEVIRRWSSKHFPTSYAGMYFAGGKVSGLVVGYTARQAIRVRAVKRLPGLVEPSRVSGFLYTPKYSLGELTHLQEKILTDVMRNDAYSGLLVGVGVTVRANRVDVGTERVKRARRVLERLYGPEAPIRVRHEEGPVEVMRSGS